MDRTFKVNDQGQIKNFGTLHPDGVFEKIVQKSLHHLRKWNAYGMDKKVMEQIGGLGCSRVRIKDSETGEVWEASYEIFKREGFDFKFNRFELQHFLIRKWWMIKDQSGKIIQEEKII